MSEEKLTMDDFSAELELPSKKLRKATCSPEPSSPVDEKEVILDLKYYAEGVIAPRTSATSLASPLKDAVQVGDEITATVI